MEKYKVQIKASALKQLKSFPKEIRDRILTAISNRLTTAPHIADGKHIKKLTTGYRLRVGNYRIFYYIESNIVTITSIVRRTSTTY